MLTPIANQSEKVKEKQAQFHQLLTEEAASLIIAMENGAKIERVPAQFTPLTNLRQGDRITNVFRILYFNEPKAFTRENRSGLLLALTLRSSEGECTLLLWNDDGRKVLASEMGVNDAVLVTGAVVKNVNPPELNSDLLTKIEKCNFEVDIPLRSVKTPALNEVKPTEELISINGFATRIGEVKRFQREKNGGKLCRATLTDGTAFVPLVCWGEYADMLHEIENNSLVSITDARVKINKLNNVIEIHSAPSTRIVKKNEKLRAGALVKNIGEFGDGETAQIQATVKELKEVKTIKLCDKCFSAIKTGDCNCGGKGIDTVIAEAVLMDEGGELTCSFFDSRALQLLEMKSVAPDIAQVAGELKRGALKGKKLNVKITTKFNNFLNQLTANCKEIL